MPIIDFHTHAFPDAIAARAVPMLEAAAGERAKLDGRISSLLKSMDEAGIERSVICSIATKPEHFAPILKWSQEIASERIVPLASVHPADPLAAQQVRAVARAGLCGIKLHPYYQNFDMDEERVLPLYEAAQECGLIVLCHTGFDIAYPRDRKCDPVRIARVIELFPKLALVASHLGAWEDWDEVRKHLIGKPVYLETSFSIPYVGLPAAKALLEAHRPDYLLFGTDSPWKGQKTEVAEIRSLRLPAQLEQRILYDNARRLLGSQKDEL